MTHYQVSVHEKIWKDSISICLRRRVGDKYAYMSDVVFSVPEEYDSALFVPFSLDLPIETAQELMDGLWQCGLRPTEGSGSAGAMKQAEEHITTLKKENEQLHRYISELLK